MGVKVSDLLEEAGEATVHIGGQAIGLVYRVLWEEHFSEEEWEQIKERSGRDYLTAVLPKLLKSWDLTDGDGNPIPVTAEAIGAHNVPTRFLRLAEQAVLEAQDGPKGGASSSPATWPQAAT